MHTIGVLTGGGDAPGLNAVIRAVVRTAIRDYDMEVLGIEDGFEGLVHVNVTPLTAERVRGILPRGGTILGTTNRGNPFKYFVREGDNVRQSDESHRVVENMRRLGIEGLIVIGGDGSLKIGQGLHALGVPLVGVPKTIDNDISATEVTFGFNTALDTATEAIDKLHTTAESHHRIMVLEVMGRDTGWIALHSGIAGGADIILIPEIPYDPDRVAAKVQERHESSSHFSIVVVAEGARRRGGEARYLDSDKVTGYARLGGIADLVSAEIIERTNLDVRVTRLGHLQRGGSPIAFDRMLGSRLGKAAVDALVRGAYGQMVAVIADRVVTVPIADAVASVKFVDPAGEKVACARSLGISFGD